MAKAIVWACLWYVSHVISHGIYALFIEESNKGLPGACSGQPYVALGCPAEISVLAPLSAAPCIWVRG